LALRALRVFRVPRTFARKCTLRGTTHIRAKIIGERTPGVVLTADFVKLPNGATFLYPNTQTITADGTVLEGHGVVPDIEVSLDRNELLQGKDTQLEAAINFVLKK
jgi:C-terminal processing protease CtpA/Prc